MRHTYEIISADIANEQTENKDFIDVKVQVYLDEQPHSELKFGYDLDHDEMHIRKDLNRVMHTLDTDLENLTKNAEREARNAKAKETISSLVDLMDHTVTKADMKANPELAEEGVKVGDVIKIKREEKS